MSGDDLDFGVSADVPPPPSALGAGQPGHRPQRTRGAQPKGQAPFRKKWCKAHGDYEDIELFRDKDAMCKPMKQAYEGAVTQSKNQKEQKFVKQLIGGRPEDFQLFMARFSTEAARFGRGRLFFDIAKFKFYLTSRQGQGLKWVAKMMDQKQYFKFAQSVEGGSKGLQEAAEQWNVWSETDDRNVAKDMKHGSLRVAVHVEDLVYGYTEIESGKTLEQEQKQLKQPTADQINDLSKQVLGGGEGLHSFGSATSQNVGGAMGRALAMTGSSFVAKDGSMGGMSSRSPNKPDSSFTGFLAEFGFQAENSAKGRGQKRPVEDGAGPSAGEAPAPDAGNAPPPLPPPQESLAPVPEPKKQRKDNLMVYALKMTNNLSSVIHCETNKGKEIRLMVDDIQTEWDAMTPETQNKYGKCWADIVKLRFSLLTLLLENTGKEGETNLEAFLKARSDEEKGYLGDRSSCKMLHEMKAMVQTVNSKDNHDAVDVVKAEVIAMIADFKEVCKDVKHAVRDYRSNKNMYDKQTQKYADKEVADAVARANAGSRPSVKSRGLNAAGAKVTPDIFLVKCPEESRFTTYENLADFKAAVARNDVNAESPYLVKHAPLSMSEATKTQLTAFARDFPQSLVCKGPQALYRGQGFFKHEDTPLDTELMQFAPPGCQLKPDTANVDPLVVKHLTKCTFIGRAPKQSYIGPDFNQMGGSPTMQ